MFCFVCILTSSRVWREGMGVCVCVGGDVKGPHAGISFSFRNVRSWNWTQISRPDSKDLDLLGHLTGLFL